MEEMYPFCVPIPLRARAFELDHSRVPFGFPPAQRVMLVAYRVLLDWILEWQLSDLVAPGDPTPLALTAWSTVHD